MDIDLPTGKYVVAVSGGVDSMVLLDILAKKMNKRSRRKNELNTTADVIPASFTFVVAHFDHGIRPDSGEDRKLVQRTAAGYGIPFVFDQAELGPKASEATAREARYRFLHKVKTAFGAGAIITAHHQDDVLETVIINFMRGTKSRGLSSLRSSKELRRPLLGWTKQQIRDYAKEHNLAWREDSTNVDTAYLRNYIRLQIMPTLDIATRTQLLEHSQKAAVLNDAIQKLTDEYLANLSEPLALDRTDFQKLPSEVAHEVLVAWLRAHTDVGITAKLISRLSRAIVEGRNGATIDVARGYQILLGRQAAKLVAPR